jgi:hypothetical protein
MPADRPDALELVEAAAEHLAISVRPALSGHAAFEALIAANLLAIARRELELGPPARAAERERLRTLLGRDGGLDELEEELVARIRAGELRPGDPQLMDHLRATVRDRLRIANPGYL